MATKKSLSLLQLQKQKLKKQRALATTPKARALLDRQINRVQVRIVDTQKLLKASPSQNALPPSSKGGDLKTTKGPRRRNVNTNQSGGTRTGQPGKGGSSPSAEQMRQATRRAGVQSRRPGISGLLSALSIGATVGTAMQNNLPKRRTSSNRGAGRATENVEETSTPTKKKGMSNIPPREGTGKGSPNDKTKVTPSQSSSSSSASKTPVKTPAKPKRDRMEKASSSERMAAWAKANRKMIEKSGTKKQKELLAKALKKKKPQSAANKAGYPGNRNY